MDYVTVFEIDKYFVSSIHIIMILACILIAGYIFYAFKNKYDSSIIDRVMLGIVFLGFVIITSYSVITSNVESVKLSEYLQNQTCSIVEGEVSSFHTPTWLGHDSESFYVDDIFFEYSNSVEVGYSQTKAAGGCVVGNGQNLRISYVSMGGVNVILRIEERIVKDK